MPQRETSSGSSPPSTGPAYALTRSRARNRRSPASDADGPGRAKKASAAFKSLRNTMESTWRGAIATIEVSSRQERLRSLPA